MILLMRSTEYDWCVIIDGVGCCGKLFMILLIEKMVLSRTGVLKEKNCRTMHAQYFKKNNCGNKEERKGTRIFHLQVICNSTHF